MYFVVSPHPPLTIKLVPPPSMKVWTRHWAPSLPVKLSNRNLRDVYIIQVWVSFPLMALYNFVYLIQAQVSTPLRVIPVRVYSGCCTRSRFSIRCKNVYHNHVDTVRPLILVWNLSPGRQFSRKQIRIDINVKKLMKNAKVVSSIWKGIFNQFTVLNPLMGLNSSNCC